MSRNHRELRVFHDAHRLTLAIYKENKGFPREEWFGLRLQIRKAAVSIGANIVEGSARRTTAEYCNFLNVALGSAAEAAYLIELASELRFISDTTLVTSSSSVLRQMQKLADAMEARRVQEEQARRRSSRRPRPGPTP
jgi:four helix bundle protein